MFTVADIQQLREYISTDEPAERTLDKLDGYLAGMQFVAESREREIEARSDRAKKGTRTVKVRKPRAASNGKLRVGDAASEGDAED